jgi:Carbohydrate family 9 binding domain-like
VNVASVKQLSVAIAALLLRNAGGMPARRGWIVLEQRQPHLTFDALFVVLALLGSTGTDAHAQLPPATAATTREFQATRTPRPPVIDGRLNDEMWTQAQVLSDFTQQDPDEGMPATERTEVRILYDDNALYFGARLFDHEAAQIGRRLSTRDGDGDADRITLYLDSMHDHLTGAMFRVSAANVQTDAVLFNDTWDDWSWNAVWQSQVTADSDGWSVEMRIPLSQLRFPSSDKQTWGFNVERYIRRKNEAVWLEMVPKRENGRASRMIHLAGFDGLKPSRRTRGVCRS